MWDLVKSVIGAIVDVIAAVVSFVWDIFVWVAGKLIDILVWIFEFVVKLYFEILKDLIINHLLSFVITLAVLGIGYFLWDRWQKRHNITPERFYQNPLIMTLILLPVVTSLLGLVADSGPVSIVQQSITIEGSVDRSTVQIGPAGGSGLLGVPTAIWSALIAAVATIAAAIIALRKK